MNQLTRTQFVSSNWICISSPENWIKSNSKLFNSGCCTKLFFRSWLNAGKSWRKLNETQLETSSARSALILMFFIPPRFSQLNNSFLIPFIWNCIFMQQRCSSQGSEERRGSEETFHQIKKHAKVKNSSRSFVEWRWKDEMAEWEDSTIIFFPCWNICWMGVCVGDVCCYYFC